MSTHYYNQLRTTMSDLNEKKEFVKKPSYTERLLAQLKMDIPTVPNDVIESIQAFAKAQSLIILFEEDKDDTVVQFGKYVNKSFEAIHAIDSNYCQWLFKSKKYLRAGQLENLKKVLGIE